MKAFPDKDPIGEAFECFFEVVRASCRPFTFAGLIQDGDYDRLWTKLDQTLLALGRCLRQKNKADREEVDWYTPPKPWMAGGLLIDWLSDLDDEGGVFNQRLKCGDTISEYELLSALLMVQVDRALICIEQAQPLQVAQFWGDIAQLRTELAWIEDQQEAKRNESERAALRARKRHAPRDRVRDAIIAEFSTRKWASVLQASHELAPVAARLARETGWRLSEQRVQKTVYDWLLRSQKEKGT